MSTNIGTYFIQQVFYHVLVVETRKGLNRPFDHNNQIENLAI